MPVELHDLRPVLAPLISALCAGGVFVMGASARWRAIWSLAAAGVKFIIVWSMLPGSLAGSVYVFRLGEVLPGLAIAFRVDAFGLFFALVTATLWIVTTVYALAYMRGSHALRRFFGFFALCISTTVAIAFAENLFTLFLFYELLTVCTYPLVIHGQDAEARRAGRKYLAYTLAGGAAILAGMLLVYQAAGTLSLAEGGILAGVEDQRILFLIFVTLVGGFGVKAAIIPLHAWLPAAMVAPTPVSALLHAVAVVKAGAFGVVRVLYDVFGVNLLKTLGLTAWLGYLAGFTIIAGSIMAMRQNHFKARLAWSTISQLSYILLAASLLTPAGALAAIIHLANQAFTKVTMFFVAGAIEHNTGKTHIDQLDGIGYRMPWTMAAFTIAGLSFMGVPLLAGFITKWYLSLGALSAGRGGFVALMALSGLLNATYWLPIVYRAYFRATGIPRLREETPWMMLAPILICAAYIVLLGTGAQAPLMPFSLAESAVRLAFGLKGGLP
ncbi:MAG: proton-conducting transporter membrane subunit [Wenzhouxiangella sp.]